jgi:hypothetical protein
MAGAPFSSGLRTGAGGGISAMPQTGGGYGSTIQGGLPDSLLLLALMMLALGVAISTFLSTDR